MQRRTLILVIFLFLAAAAPRLAHGASLSEYGGRVRLAIAAADGAKSSAAEDDDISSAIRELQTIKTYLPAHETVDVHGNSIATDYAWLHKAIDDVKQGDSDAFIEAAGAIRDRLSAIEERIAELERAAAADPTKDRDKQKLDEILGREEYHIKPPERSWLGRSIDELMKWLEEHMPHSSVTPSVGGLPNFAIVLQILLYAAIALLLGFVLYKLLPHISARFRSRSKETGGERVILGEKIAADESSSDLLAEAERYAAAGELRLAIRKGYIALLCELSDRRIIGLARHKTNRDYLRDLRREGPLLAHVTSMTGEYERHWYGFDASEQADWERFRGLYNEALAKAGRSAG